MNPKTPIRSKSYQPGSLNDNRCPMGGLRENPRFLSGLGHKIWIFNAINLLLPPPPKINPTTPTATQIRSS